MPTPQLIGADDSLMAEDAPSRQLYLLSIDFPESLPTEIELSSPRFTCLLIWDAASASVGQISLVARKLLDSGAVYVCCWGSDCQRVEDIIDETVVEDLVDNVLDNADDDDSTIMTTSHSRESVEEAIFFLLSCARPAGNFAENCYSSLALIIGRSGHETKIRTAFASPGKFVESFCEKG